jgi:hypothetical protein
MERTRKAKKKNKSQNKNKRRKSSTNKRSVVREQRKQQQQPRISCGVKKTSKQNTDSRNHVNDDYYAKEMWHNYASGMAPNEAASKVKSERRGREGGEEEVAAADAECSVEREKEE